MLAYAWITAQEVVVGFTVGSVAALLAAMLFLWLPGWLEDFLYRVIVTLNSTPVRGPRLAGGVSGSGSGSRARSSSRGCTRSSPCSTRPTRSSSRSSRSASSRLDVYGATWWQRIFLLKLPSALPIVFVSLKGGVMAAVNGAIVGELFGAFEGLGYMILDSRYVGNTVRVFLAAVFCTLIGWLLGLVALAERAPATVAREHGARPRCALTVP